MTLQRFFMATAALCMLGIGNAALAQYVWLDEKGGKQYSDMPPPPSTPAKRILKMPGKLAAPGADAGSAAPDGKNAQNKDQTPPTLAEQNAAFRKRQDEQAAKDKKAADSAREASEKAKNCENARAYQRTLDSGQRIAHIDKNGQRAILDDSQREQETRDNKRALDECN